MSRVRHRPRLLESRGARIRPTRAGRPAYRRQGQSNAERYALAAYPTPNDAPLSKCLVFPRWFESNHSR